MSNILFWLLITAAIVNIAWALWYVHTHPDEGPYGENWDL